MRVVCAWCGDLIAETFDRNRDFGDETTPIQEDETHGICPPCLKDELADQQIPEDVIDEEHARRGAELLESPAFRNS